MSTSPLSRIRSKRSVTPQSVAAVGCNPIYISILLVIGHWKVGGGELSTINHQPIKARVILSLIAFCQPTGDLRAIYATLTLLPGLAR